MMPVATRNDYYNPEMMNRKIANRNDYLDVFQLPPQPKLAVSDTDKVLAYFVHLVSPDAMYLHFDEEDRVNVSLGRFDNGVVHC